MYNITTLISTKTNEPNPTLSHFLVLLEEKLIKYNYNKNYLYKYRLFLKLDHFLEDTLIFKNERVDFPEYQLTLLHKEEKINYGIDGIPQITIPETIIIGIVEGTIIWACPIDLDIAFKAWTYTKSKIAKENIKKTMKFLAKIQASRTNSILEQMDSQEN